MSMRLWYYNSQHATGSTSGCQLAGRIAGPIDGELAGRAASLRTCPIMQRQQPAPPSNMSIYMSVSDQQLQAR